MTPFFITNGDRLEQKVFFSSLPKKTENPLSEISEAEKKKTKTNKNQQLQLHSTITLEQPTDWAGGFTVLRALVCYKCMWPWFHSALHM